MGGGDCRVLEGGGDFGGWYVDARDEDAVEEGEEGDCVVNERDSSKRQEKEGKVCTEESQEKFCRD